MATSKERDKGHEKGQLPTNTPPILSPQEWETARQQLLVSEKNREIADVTTTGLACGSPIV